MATTAFLYRSSGLLNRGPGGPASLGHVPQSSIFSPTATAQSGAWGPTLLGTGFLYRILCPTDWISCALSYIIDQRPPSSSGCHQSFNPSTVKVIFWYSSTGCTCCLHWCISYFDSPAGSEVSIQQWLGFQWQFKNGTSISENTLLRCNLVPSWWVAVGWARNLTIQLMTK